MNIIYINPDEMRADVLGCYGHPLVRTHPYCDRNSLYISPNHIVQIGDRDHDETEAMLERLVAWADRPDFTYRHEWRVNDVVLWDNASVMHRRDAFPGQQRRFLKRTGFHFPEALGTPYCTAAR